jgi:hypothetical protein
LLDEILLCSRGHRGATGPVLFKIAMHVKYIGKQKITAEAGTFDSYYFQVVSAPGLPEAHPDYDIWCTSDGNFTFQRGDIGGYMQTYYELTELVDNGE